MSYPGYLQRIQEPGTPRILAKESKSQRRQPTSSVNRHLQLSRNSASCWLKMDRLSLRSLRKVAVPLALDVLDSGTSCCGFGETIEL